MKLSWLQDSLLEQADKMEQALDQKPDFEAIRATQRQQVFSQIERNRNLAMAKQQGTRLTSDTGSIRLQGSQQSQSGARPQTPAQRHALYMQQVKAQQAITRKRNSLRPTPQTPAPAKNRKAAAREAFANRWAGLPEWRQNVMRAKFKLYYSTQMMMYYFNHKKKGCAEYLDPSSVSLAVTQHFGHDCPRVIRLQNMLVELEAFDGGASEAVREALQRLGPQVNAIQTEDADMCTVMESPSGQAGPPQEPDRLPALMRDVRMRLVMHANKANGAWVSKCQLTAPYVFDPARDRCDRQDPMLFEPLVLDLLSTGGLVLQFVDTNEATVSARNGSLCRVPLAFTDLWDPVTALFPSRVPTGARVEGVALIGRLVLEAISQVVRLAGWGAIELLKVILHVDEASVNDVLQSLLRRSLYGIKPGNLLVLPIPRFAGSVPEKDTLKAMRPADETSPQRSAGAGAAMLSCGWPSFAFRLDPEHVELGWQLCAHTAYEWAVHGGGKWFHTMMMSDIDLLRPSAMLNLDFLATTLMMSSLHGANMVTEVQRALDGHKVGQTDMSHRLTDSVVLAHEGCSPYCVNATASNFAAAAAQQVYLGLMARDGAVLPSSTHRYMFLIRSLQALLKGPGALAPNVVMDGPLAYLTYNLGDISTIPGARCMAIQAARQRQGPHLGAPKGVGPGASASPEDSSWLLDIVPLLNGQDNGHFYRTHSVLLTAKDDPVVIKHRDGSSVGLRIALVVSSNRVSQQALSLLHRLSTSDGDRLFIVHFARDGDQRRNAEGLLKSFDAQAMAGQVEKFCEVRGDDSLFDAVHNFCQDRKINMLVIGSDSLASSVSETVIGSISLSLVKAVTSVPVLVVKTNSVGPLFRMTAEEEGAFRAGETRPPLKVMIEASPTSRLMLKWTCEHFKPDEILLARGRAYDDRAQLQMSASRIFDSLKQEARNCDVNAVQLRPHELSNAQAFPIMSMKDKVDVLVVQAPNSRNTPSELLDILRRAQTSVLVFRGAEQ